MGQGGDQSREQSPQGGGHRDALSDFWASHEAIPTAGDTAFAVIGPALRLVAMQGLVEGDDSDSGFHQGGGGSMVADQSSLASQGVCLSSDRSIDSIDLTHALFPAEYGGLGQHPIDGGGFWPRPVHPGRVVIAGIPACATGSDSNASGNTS